MYTYMYTYIYLYIYLYIHLRRSVITRSFNSIVQPRPYADQLERPCVLF